jgi:hypothetical protein
MLLVNTSPLCAGDGEHYPVLQSCCRPVRCRVAMASFEPCGRPAGLVEPSMWEPAWSGVIAGALRAVRDASGGCGGRGVTGGLARAPSRPVNKSTKSSGVPPAEPQPLLSAHLSNASI